MSKKLIIVSLLTFFVVGFMINGVTMAAYPEKPITMIVMYPAGGNSDTFARALQPGLEESLGVNIVIQNVDGGGGAVGFNQARVADPDGYTVTIPNNALFTLEGMGHVNFGYEDFDMIARVILEDYTLTVNSDLGWEEFSEFIDAVEENPGKYTIATSGVGSSSDIVAKVLLEKLGLDMRIIPYGGGGELLSAAMGGHVDAIVQSPGEVNSAVENGDLITLALLGEERNNLMPNVPTVKELGYDFSVNQWRGIGTPKGVSEEVVSAWEEAVEHAVTNERFIEVIEENFGATISPAYGEELDDFVNRMANIFIPYARQASQ